MNGGYNREVVSNLGNYNPEGRKEQVLRNWGRESKLARNAILEKVKNLTNKNDTSSGKNHVTRTTGDPLKLAIRAKRQEVEAFQEESEKFEGPHFTKLFRQLRSMCLGVQEGLDKIDTAGNEEFRKMKKELIAEAESIWSKVLEKVHGEVCPECQVEHV